jgi:stress-induced morphogen
MVEVEVLEERIREGVGDVTHLAIRDLTGTKDHWEAVVVAGSFTGKSPIEQHQMVYAALGDLMAGPVHALALKTYSPDNWPGDEG